MTNDHDAAMSDFNVIKMSQPGDKLMVIKRIKVERYNGKRINIEKGSSITLLPMPDGVLTSIPHLHGMGDYEGGLLHVAISADDFQHLMVAERRSMPDEEELLRLQREKELRGLRLREEKYIDRLAENEEQIKRMTAELNELRARVRADVAMAQADEDPLAQVPYTRFNDNTHAYDGTASGYCAKCGLPANSVIHGVHS